MSNLPSLLHNQLNLTNRKSDNSFFLQSCVSARAELANRHLVLGGSVFIIVVIWLIIPPELRRRIYAALPTVSMRANDASTPRQCASTPCHGRRTYRVPSIHGSSLNPQTRFDLSPSNLAASTSRLPEAPSLRRAREADDENLDPALWTPSKKMRMLYAHLGNTSAGSLLLRSPKLKTSDSAILSPVIQHFPGSIPRPDWSL
ncbi:hypothetical protein B0H11DRAFT_2226606 [Mycena galericulata]|nr:hypothetical protein B0H11DRAFT_2226606 [Mycena galericulata]